MILTFYIQGETNISPAPQKVFNVLSLFSCLIHSALWDT